MDRRGSGIQRILNSYKNYSKEPTFYSDENIFLVTMPNRSFTGAKRVQKIPPQYTGKVTLANKSKGQIAEKSSLMKEVSGQTDEKVTLANKSKGQIAEKSSLTKKVVGQTDEKVTLANKVSGQTAEKSALANKVSGQTAEKSALANKVSGQTAKKCLLANKVGVQNIEKSFSEYEIKAEDLPIRLDPPAVDNIIDAIAKKCKRKNRQDPFQARTLEKLANFYMKYKLDYSFNRDALTAFFNIRPDAATKIIRKCCDLGIMRREKRGVYFFINLD